MRNKNKFSVTNTHPYTNTLSRPFFSFDMKRKWKKKKMCKYKTLLLPKNFFVLVFKEKFITSQYSFSLFLGLLWFLFTFFSHFDCILTMTQYQKGQWKMSRIELIRKTFGAEKWRFLIISLEVWQRFWYQNWTCFVSYISLRKNLWGSMAVSGRSLKDFFQTVFSNFYHCWLKADTLPWLVKNDFYHFLRAGVGAENIVQSSCDVSL